jgi:rhodanese-related sulfurtransferase
MMLFVLKRDTFGSNLRTPQNGARVMGTRGNERAKVWLNISFQAQKTGVAAIAIKNVFEHTNALKAKIENLSVDELQSEMNSNSELLLIDLREIQEVVDLGTIPSARNVARGMLEFWADPASPYYRDYFAEDKRIVTFCASGGRSVYATLALKDMGYANVAHLEVGFNGWKKAGGEVQDVSATSKWMRRDKA